MVVDDAVRNRYSAASKEVEAALCCPVDYDPRFLEVIPQEVLERDYGCGDPSKHLRAGETVLDLGSGGGKICFIAAQVVGQGGRVIGVDTNREMLALARGARAEVSERLGFDNVRFLRGQIEDLGTNPDRVDVYLQNHPIHGEEDLSRFEAWRAADVVANPLVADGSVDVVVSNCVLNLVAEIDKPRLFAEIFRVLKRGGRAVISDIVSDEPVTEAMKGDAELWSGCVSGAFEETAFLAAFEEAGFYGITLLKRDEKPWRTVEGIEFRSVTVEAFKGKQGECWDHKEALVYKGPFSSVSDDDGHTYRRGERTAVCRKTYEIFRKAPYAAHFEGVEPRVAVAPDELREFPCTAGTLLRSPVETKGEGYDATLAACEDNSCC